MKSLEALDKKFTRTKLGKRVAKEIDDVLEQLHDTLEYDQKKHTLHIDNKDL